MQNVAKMNHRESRGLRRRDVCSFDRRRSMRLRLFDSLSQGIGIAGWSI
jgi:hypothetical protein